MKQDRPTATWDGQKRRFDNRLARLQRQATARRTEGLNESEQLVLTAIREGIPVSTPRDLIGIMGPASSDESKLILARLEMRFGLIGRAEFRYHLTGLGLEMAELIKDERR